MPSIADVRRAVLQQLVDIHGLAEVSRRMKKPAAQIKDMLMSRKAFGEKVAREMERNYDSTKAPGWLDTMQEGDLDAFVTLATVEIGTQRALADRFMKRYRDADRETQMLVDTLLRRPDEQVLPWVDAALISAIDTAKLLLQNRFAHNKRPRRKQAGGRDSIS